MKSDKAPPANNTAAITGSGLDRSRRNGPSEGCGAGAFTLSGMTLATWKVAVPPARESAVPSGPSRHSGGMVNVIAPGVQATTTYRTTHSPDGEEAKTAASPSGSATVPDASLPARTRQPAGAVTVRSSRIVSPTVG